MLRRILQIHEAILSLATILKGLNFNTSNRMAETFYGLVE